MIRFLNNRFNSGPKSTYWNFFADQMIRDKIEELNCKGWRHEKKSIVTGSSIKRQSELRHWSRYLKVLHLPAEGTFFVIDAQCAWFIPLSSVSILQSVCGRGSQPFFSPHCLVCSELSLFCLKMNVRLSVANLAGYHLKRLVNFGPTKLYQTG